MNEILQSPVFGILLTLIAFEIGLYLQRKTKWVACNPLLIAIIVIVIVLLTLQIPLENYQAGGDMINLFLGPSTVVLAIPLYCQVHNMKYYFVPILVGIGTGILSSILSVLACSAFFGFNQAITASLLPKSITTPIGIELSNQLGGIPAITVLTILVTGIIGAMISDTVFKLLNIDHPIAKGIALGSSAHAIGTSKALALGSIEGAMSSLAIGVSGILTVCIATPIWQWIATIW